MAAVIFFVLGIFFVGLFVIITGFHSFWAPVQNGNSKFTNTVMGLAKIFIGLGICWGVIELGTFLVHALK